MYVTRSDPAPGVAQLTLDRPDRMNALSMDLARDLLDALEDVAAEDGIGAVARATRLTLGVPVSGSITPMAQNRASFSRDWARARASSSVGRMGSVMAPLWRAGPAVPMGARTDARAPA